MAKRVPGVRLAPRRFASLSGDGKLFLADDAGGAGGGTLWRDAIKVTNSHLSRSHFVLNRRRFAVAGELGRACENFGGFGLVLSYLAQLTWGRAARNVEARTRLDRA